MTRTGANRTDRSKGATTAATKRLVAHLPSEAGSGEGWYGPSDGEPVDLPAPCVRVKAGYWCPCGASFIGTATWETTHFARVVPIGHGDPPKYIDDRDGGYEAPVPVSSSEEREALRAQVEAMPLGTVVERHGTGIARRFCDAPIPALADGSDEWVL